MDSHTRLLEPCMYGLISKIANRIFCSAERHGDGGVRNGQKMHAGQQPSEKILRCRKPPSLLAHPFGREKPYIW